MYLGVLSLAEFYFYYVCKWSSNKYRKAEMVLFVDDANILTEDANGDILNYKTNRVPKESLIWFDGNGLVINMKKTTAVSFHTWQNRSFLKPQIIINDVNINYKQETKFLDLYVTESMKFDVHIRNVISELGVSYYVMQSLKGIISSNILRRTYSATYHLHFRHGILFGRRQCGKLNNFLNYQRKF